MTDEEKRKRACENSRRYYQSHKDEILAKQYVYKKKKYKEDPEYRKKVYENSRRWIKKNPEKAYAIKRKWQVEHREPTKDEIIERLQKTHCDYKEKCNDYNVGCIKEILYNYQKTNNNLQQRIDKALEKLDDTRMVFKEELINILRGKE